LLARVWGEEADETINQRSPEPINSTAYTLFSSTQVAQVVDEPAEYSTGPFEEQDQED